MTIAEEMRKRLSDSHRDFMMGVPRQMTIENTLETCNDSEWTTSMFASLTDDWYRNARALSIFYQRQNPNKPTEKELLDTPIPV